MFRIVLLLSAVVLSASGQLLLQQVAHVPIVAHPALAHPELAHEAVLQSGAWEAQLPPHLQKSAKFYGNPRTAAHLAEESWFTAEEHPVFSRKAEEIDRSQITKIFRNSGLQKRK